MSVESCVQLTFLDTLQPTSYALSLFRGCMGTCKIKGLTQKPVQGHHIELEMMDEPMGVEEVTQQGYQTVPCRGIGTRFIFY